MKQPIFKRICKAFENGKMQMSFRDLAAEVFPDKTSWNYSSNGGPPGCFIALSAALRRNGISEFYDQHNHRIVMRPRATIAKLEAELERMKR